MAVVLWSGSGVDCTEVSVYRCTAADGAAGI